MLAITFTMFRMTKKTLMLLSLCPYWNNDCKMWHKLKLFNFSGGNTLHNNKINYTTLFITVKSHLNKTFYINYSGKAKSAPEIKSAPDLIQFRI